MLKFRRSLLTRLQWGFAAGSFLMAGAMALVMDAALKRSLDAEDALALSARARELSAGLPSPAGGSSHEPAPERIEWLLLAEPRRQSAGFPDLDLATLPPSQVRVAPAGGRDFAVLRWPRPGGDLVVAMDRTHEEALVAGFRHTLFAAAGGGALLAALLGRLVAARGLRPLHDLAEEAAAIRPGSLQRRLDPSHYPDELGEVVARLNGALEGLEEAFDRLSGLAGELAHELRTPIQGLRAEAEALIRRGEGPPDALGSILEECDRLAAQVEQMLFLARAEDPGALLHREPFEVRGLLTEVADFFEASADEAGVRLEVEAGAGCRLEGDRALVGRALHNLLANALRHTPQGGRIVLSALPLPGGVALAVVDTGTGIPDALLPALGRRWAKGPGSRGLGLGLAIVQSIARVHGGSLDIQPAKGGGTEARMEFPDLKKT
jgi:two-component system heavy metal sensor histidine kinase CusS